MELSHATNIDTSQHGVIRQDQQGTNAQKRYVSTEVTGYEVRDDGTIVARGLRGDALEQRLAEIFE